METVVVEVIKVDQFDTGTVTEFFEEGAAQIIVVEKQREVFLQASDVVWRKSGIYSANRSGEEVREDIGFFVPALFFKGQVVVAQPYQVEDDGDFYSGIFSEFHCVPCIYHVSGHAAPHNLGTAGNNVCSICIYVTRSL